MYRALCFTQQSTSFSPGSISFLFISFKTIQVNVFGYKIKSSIQHQLQNWKLEA
jgi:hypothetical protein